MSKWVRALGTAALVVVLDQIAKTVVTSHLELHRSVSVIHGFFALTYVRNTGAAFGLLAGRLEDLRVPFFLTVSLLALAVLIGFLRGLPPERRAVTVACGAVLGGAIGNMIDRFAFGEVIDFLDVYVGAYHWPAFNVADAAITIGVIVLCLDALLAPAPAHSTS